MPELMQELNEIRTLAREFARAELRPGVEKWDHDRALPAAVLEQVAELGFFGMTVPDASGGMGFDLPTYAAALEEIAWGEPVVALLLMQSAIAAKILQQGQNGGQQLESIASGAVQMSLALAEESAGSDLGEAGTRAQRAGAGWTLKGKKAWVSNGETAHFALVLARTGSDDEFGLFLTPRSALTVSSRVNTMGLRALPVTDLALDNTTVPADALLLGGPLAGILSAWSDLGRISIAAISLGVAQAALEHAVGYADTREQFGRKLHEFEGMQYKLADMATRTEAARSLVQRAAAEADSRLIAMAKVFASETAMWVTTNAVQVFGGYGYMRDYPVEKTMRDAKGLELLEGANELLRVDIARALYE